MFYPIRALLNVQALVMLGFKSVKKGWRFQLQGFGRKDPQTTTKEQFLEYFEALCI